MSTLSRSQGKIPNTVSTRQRESIGPFPGYSGRRNRRRESFLLSMLLIAMAVIVAFEIVLEMFPSRGLAGYTIYQLSRR